MSGQQALNLRQRAGWMPAAQDDLESWLADLQDRADARGDVPLHPAVAELAALIDCDPLLRMNLARVVNDAPAVSSRRRPPRSAYFFGSWPQFIRL